MNTDAATAAEPGLVAAPRNEHWSFSRLTRFESCPLSYKLHYLDRLPSEPTVPLQFGKLIHAVLEELYVEHTLDERVAPLRLARAYELFQRDWPSSGLTGRELFGAGLDILKTYCAAQGVVDHRTVLAIEKEFRLPIGGGEVLGYIDRIDRVDDETIEVVDYKTNYQIFSREEVDESLQLGLYELAVRRLYPWVKRVRLSYLMLRHGAQKQSTSRSPEALEATLRYAATLGAAMDTTEDFPARVGPNCVYCDHRRSCDAYRAALDDDRREQVTLDPDDLVQLSRERERAAALAKIHYARRDEIDRILKAHLKNTDELVLASTRYSMLKITSSRYPLERTLDVLAEATGRGHEDLAREVCVVEKDKLKALLDEHRAVAGPSRAALLRAELDAVAEKSVTGRLWAKSIKSPAAKAPPAVEAGT